MLNILGTSICLNAMLRDTNDLNRYFKLEECEIPLAPCEPDKIIKLIKLLLSLRVSEFIFFN